MPSLRIELDQLPPGLCRLLGHEKPPLERGAPPSPSKLGGNITIMPRRAYLIFGDIEGRLNVLRVECTPNAPAKAAIASAGSSRNTAGENLEITKFNELSDH
jgi:hypothetical protein